MNDPVIIGDAVLYKGDCLEILPTLEAGSVDAVVTDSPYGLEFMGKKWDAPWEHGFSRHGFSDGAARRPGPQFSSSRNPVCRKCHKQKRGNKKCACQIPDFDDTERRLLNAMRLGAWHETWARECLRVLKPGGYLLAFGGSRTFHRLACAIEDAGWEIRDCVMWVYGSGFPKSLDVSKAIDKAMFTTRTLNPDFQAVRAWLRGKVKDKGLTYREIDAALGNENSHKASHYLDNSQPQLPTVEDWGIIKGLLQLDDADDLDRPPRLLVETFERKIVGYRTVRRGVAFSSDGPPELPITKPICEASARWQGWGTALKPAWEPIIVARKPLDGTVAANVQKHGTGGMNIDGCRVGTEPLSQHGRRDGENRAMSGRNYAEPAGRSWSGRWPANFVHDGSEEVVGLFPVAAGASGKASGPTRGKLGTQGRYGSATGENMGESAFYGDSGSAARFFYCAKASKEDRDEGLDGVGPGRDSDRVKDDGPGGANPRNRTNAPRRNHHPTVKPTALMRWLVRLVTPPGGVVLDPFMGSGSTGKACAKERFQFLGIELDADYFDIACRRIEDAMTGGPLLAEAE